MTTDKIPDGQSDGERSFYNSHIISFTNIHPPLSHCEHRCPHHHCFRRILASWGTDDKKHGPRYQVDMLTCPTSSKSSLDPSVLYSVESVPTLRGTTKHQSSVPRLSLPGEKLRFCPLLWVLKLLHYLLYHTSILILPSERVLKENPGR